jgi:predicted transcriptional regulator
VDADATVQDAAQLMAEEDVHSLLVSDGGEICGVVTDRDLIMRGTTNVDVPPDARVGDIVEARSEAGRQLLGRSRRG